LDKDHLWHMAEIARLAEPGDKLMVANPTTASTSTIRAAPRP